MILSLPKLLGLLAVIWLVWTAVRFFETRHKNSSNQFSDDSGSKPAGEDGTPEKEAFRASVDLQECDRCGTWFSGETCGRENCPK